MIYSVNFLDMTEKLNPIVVYKYLEQTGWRSIQYKRTDVKVYQITNGQSFKQVMVPLNKEFVDYKQAMLDVIKEIADVENRSIEQVMLYLLNPNADILKIHIEKKDMESGNILFDDAIRLYENAKKLLAATAQDIINPQKIHYGRIGESVQNFLNQCRFGQTEIGSYVVSVVCPFAELSAEEGYKQLSIFSDEERCANSLTRHVTNKLMDNIAYIKKQIDEGREENLLNEDVGISSNFFEALNGLNFQEDNSSVEFRAEWAPAVKMNRSCNNQIKVTNDYYQPLESLIDKIREETNQRTEIIGRIKELSAVPTIDQRDGGTISIVFLSSENRTKTVVVSLSKDDYENAIEAHRKGKVVKVIGDLSGNRILKMENALFSIIE